ncbi:uncharacterized protein PV07_05196 [Cladophialophora immunda]|uniref:Uncharacterized protein n=1 Tax=Cladophialophora immunda TaxID=569365 RepID=A0A0D2CDZ4_9EURO|nr:uncharacterized protein PV07_05196 [Cladophialophora immunda]KIW29378.1 hypothetical protein PV07_05196 [Cladophialophora immunda]
MAGIARTKKIAPVQFALKTLDDDDWDTILRVNLDGVKNSLRAEIQCMQDGRSIVNASRTAGQSGPPNSSPYTV